MLACECADASVAPDGLLITALSIAESEVASGLAPVAPGPAGHQAGAVAGTRQACAGASRTMHRLNICRALQ